MMAFPQLASLGTAVSLLSCCLGLAAQTLPAEQASAWQAAATLTEGVNTNVLLGFQRPKADATTALQLDLGRSWKGPHWDFSATYTPQAMTFARNRSLDYVAHAYHQAWQAATSTKTHMSWSLDYDHYPERGGVPSAEGGVAGVAGASQALSLQSVLNTLSSNFSISHQYSLRGTWTAGATLGLQHFTPDRKLLENLPSGTPAPPIAGTRSGSGTLGWSWKLSPDRALKLDGLDNELWFTNPAQRMRYTNAQIGLLQQFGPSVTLQAGVGPSWNEVLASAAPFLRLPGQSYAANASLTTQQGNVQYGITWQHSEQMGLVPGGVATDNIAMQYGLHWGKGWKAVASLGEGHFAGVAAASSGANRGEDSIFSSGQLSWQINRRWLLAANANWMAQTLPLSPTASGQLRRLQANFGITYTAAPAQ